MLERNLQRAVLDLCRMMHLRTAHFRSVRTTKPGANQGMAAVWTTPVAGDGAGFPDLVIVGPGGVLFRELKTERGQLGPEQTLWGEALTAGGADWGVWRPGDMRSGRIESELSELRRARGDRVG